LRSCGGLTSQDVETISFLRFFEKQPLTVKLSKFCSERIHRHTDGRVVFKFREIWPTGKLVKSCASHLTKNFAWLSSSRYCADRVQNLPGPAADNVLRVLQISSKSVHFQRSYIRTRGQYSLSTEVDLPKIFYDVHIAYRIDDAR